MVTGENNTHIVKSQARIAQIFLGYSISDEYITEKLRKIAQMKHINYQDPTIFITICAANYQKFKYLKVSWRSHISFQKTFKSHKNIKHLYHNNDKFTSKDLEWVLNQMIQENNIKHYKNVIFHGVGYGSLNENQNNDYFRFTNGLKLHINEFESRLQSLISPKIKTIVGWELYSSKVSKECGFSKCNTSILITNNTNEGKIQIQPLALKLCSRCKIKYYCCRRHQKLDWKYRHRYDCC